MLQPQKTDIIISRHTIRHYVHMNYVHFYEAVVNASFAEENKISSAVRFMTCIKNKMRNISRSPCDN